MIRISLACTIPEEMVNRCLVTGFELHVIVISNMFLLEMMFQRVLRVNSSEPCRNQYLPRNAVDTFFKNLLNTVKSVKLHSLSLLLFVPSASNYICNPRATCVPKMSILVIPCALTVNQFAVYCSALHLWVETHSTSDVAVHKPEVAEVCIETKLQIKFVSTSLLLNDNS